MINTFTLTPATTLKAGLFAILTSAAVLSTTATAVQAHEAPATLAQWTQQANAAVSDAIQMPARSYVGAPTGVVTLALTVAPNGDVIDARVERSTVRSYDAAALRAARRVDLPALPGATAPVGIKMVLGFGTNPETLAPKVADATARATRVSLAAQAR
jgi:TonB family protein